jgi:Ion channel
MMTVGYGDYVPLGKGAKLLIMGELVSGMLLLFGVFPLLISRLSTF